ncbi:hypothetical protein ACFL5O_05850 [Myxococcota bacterium]
MFPTLGLRIRARVVRAVARAKSLLREIFRPLPLVAGALDLTRTRGELIAANAMLRQQFIVASRKVRRPVFKAHERGRRHLMHVLGEDSFRYFNTSRPHQGIYQRIAVASAVKKFAEGAIVRSLPVLGGLHHDYQVAA